MTVVDKTKSKILQYDINREAAKLSALSSSELINMNILHVKKYDLLIREEWYNKQSKNILFMKGFLKNKEKQLNIQEESKYMYKSKRMISSFNQWRWSQR